MTHEVTMCFSYYRTYTVPGETYADAQETLMDALTACTAGDYPNVKIASTHRAVLNAEAQEVAWKQQQESTPD